jgi:hypothetical protein
VPTNRTPIQLGRLYNKPFNRDDATDEPVTDWGTHPAILAWLLDAMAALAARGFYCMRTAANDEEHRVGSLHYTGEAVDLRSNHIPGPELAETLAELVEIGRAHRVRVLLEHRRPHPAEHFHAEYRPDLLPDVP